MNVFTNGRIHRWWLIAGLVILTLLLYPNRLLAQAAGSAEDPAILATRLLQAVNETRSGYGIPPLQNHSLLTIAAIQHVEDMARSHLYSHMGSDGSSVGLRTQRVGYTSANGVSENWVSTRSVDGAINWWMNSYVHQRNLLNPKWTEAGIGVARDPNTGLLIFVLVFGGDGVGAPVIPSSMQATSTPALAASTGTPYVVQPGDTLLAIALRYDLAWQAVAAHNGLSEQSLLQIGQTIRLPIQLEENGSTAVGGYSENSQGYTVRSGDTLATIGARFSVPWQDLAAVNGLSSSDVLHIGQSLRIPVISSSAAVVAAATTVTPRTHTVQAGETIITIALRYDLNWQELLRINGLGENTVLSIGQEIQLD